MKITRSLQDEILAYIAETETAGNPLPTVYEYQIIYNVAHKLQERGLIDTLKRVTPEGRQYLADKHKQSFQSLKSGKG